MYVAKVCHLLSRSIQISWGYTNIQINCVVPGFMDGLDVPQKFASLSSFKQPARAEEQAKVGAFLLAYDSSHITGQSLRVDSLVTRHL